MAVYKKLEKVLQERRIIKDKIDLVSTIKPNYRSSYALIKYIASRPFAKTVSSSIDTVSDENIFRNILERIKEFFYS